METIDFKKNAKSWLDFFSVYIPDLEKKPINEENKVASLHCVNPIHNDSKSSAYLYLNSGVYGCSVCGNFSPFRFLTDIIGIAKIEASLTLSDYKVSGNFTAEDNFSKGYFVPKGLKAFADFSTKNLSPELTIVQEYLTARGLDYKTLENAGVGYLPESDNQEECLTFPYYLKNQVRALRGRTIDGRKGGVKNSQMIPYGLDTISYPKVVICEGESDTLRFRQALTRCEKEISVVGTPGAYFKQEWLREFTGVDTIYLLPQADTPSQNYMKNLKEAFGSRAIILQIPFVKGDVGKDFCDWMQYHKDMDIEEILPVNNIRKFSFSHTQILDESTKPEFPIIHNLINRGDKVIIGGPQKSMKTFTTLALVKALVTGQNAFGRYEWKIDEPQKVIFVEEEGNTIKLGQRAASVIGEVENGNILWLHKKGFKLDVEESFNDLCKRVREFEPDVLVLDPFQRLHNADENDSTAMSIIWDKLHSITTIFPDLAVILIHHFSKGNGKKGWDSLRGSSRNGGEPDVGFFITVDDEVVDEGSSENLMKLDVKIDGRDIPKLSTFGKDAGSFTLNIDTKLWNFTIPDFEVIEDETLNELLAKRILKELPAYAEELVSKLDKPFVEISDALRLLYNRKEAIRKEGGLYYKSNT